MDASTEAGNSCPQGFADCNHRPDDGCEIDLTRDVDHCGKCDVACAAAGTTEHACNDGICNVVCDATHADCDKDGKNGCEVDTQHDAANCGTCGTTCAMTGTTSNACLAGICTPACATGHADCDSDGKNGCEADLQGDPDHCGSCGTSCSAAGTKSRACMAGVCKPTCDTSHGNCDSDGKNGCEVDLSSDVNHCGQCAVACSSQHVKGRVCAAGACTPVCSTGYDDCSTKTNDGCETSLNDAASCGACGHSCLGGACASQQCQALPLASGLPTPHGLAVDATYVHWVDGTQAGGRLMRAPLAGGAATPVVSMQPGPYDVAADGQYVYWSNTGDGTSNNAAIRRVRSGDNGVLDLATAVANPDQVDGPQRIVIDSTNVYWSGASGGVFKVLKAGGGPAQIPGITTTSFGLALDSTYIYSAFLGISRAAINGSGMSAAFNVGDTLYLAVDDTYVYYAHQENAVRGIYKLAKDLGATRTQTLVAELSILPSSPIVTDGTYLYYSDGSSLSRVSKAGGNVQPLSPQVNTVFAIVLTKEAVYWSNTGDQTANGSIMKLAL